jgi:eukaryotic-like serine/threonine-protein kinase
LLSRIPNKGAQVRSRQAFINSDIKSKCRSICHRSHNRKANLVGDRKAFPFVQAPSIDIDGYFSPDGHWIAYTSNESGQSEIYVRPFPIAAGQWQVSMSGGYYPRWRQDGKELYYVSLKDELMSVEIKSGVDFQSGTPKMLGHLPPLADTISGYDVTPDGQRFLIGVFTRKADPVPLTIALNWQNELKK